MFWTRRQQILVTPFDRALHRDMWDMGVQVWQWSIMEDILNHT